MIIRSSLVVLYWTDLLCLFLLLCCSNTVLSATIDFRECYDTNGNPLRCEPRPDTFSSNKVPNVTSTCGTPQDDYCRRNGTDLLCGFTCNDGDHSPGYMTDRYLPQIMSARRTWWQSKLNGNQPVIINISLQARVQIQTINFQFVSLKPDSFYIRKSNDFGKTFSDFHYFSLDCLTEYNINSALPRLLAANETAILCTNISTSLPGHMNFVPTLHRPSSTDSSLGLSNALYNFTTATDIQVILRNFSSYPERNDTELYHALEDLAVLGKCQCNGHANVCIAEGDDLSIRRCNCTHNTAGDYCDRCADFYNDIPWRFANGTTPFECRACNCSDFATACVFDEELYRTTGSGGRCINCTNNTTGPHCEECSDGYTRADNDSCIPCECNGLATLCDKDNGTCINCTGNTYGDMCQYCIQGHYDTRDGTGCSPCPCPNVTQSCTLLDNGNIMCNDCPQGHKGDYCEMCSSGYYGDPLGIHTGISTPCQLCPCNGNINITDEQSCNNITGQCMECLYNTTGDMCQECLPGYYGDPIYAKNCTDCSCNSIGSVNSSCSNEGQCYCLPNVTGIQCSECVNSYYNYSSGEGCSYCNCNINGSIDSQCNINTGICTCKDTVMGDKCDTCITGYYGLDNIGCKACECNNQTDTCTDDPVYRCIDCPDDRTGSYCEQCNTFYYPSLHLPVNSSDYCQACNCHSDGISDDGDCHRNITDITMNGQCNCKSNVEGRNCSVCKDGYFNLQDSDPDGCQDCGCNVDLSLSQSCNEEGVCSCKQNVIGDKCHNCSLGYYYTNEYCEKCGCNVGGSLSIECRDITGQCYCRTGINGTNCTEVIPGYYFPYIDHYSYEAEDSTGLLNLSYRLPDSSDLHTGAGFAKIRNSTQVIHFGSFIPPVNGIYQLIIRYTLLDRYMWSSAALRINITSIGPTPPSGCQEYSPSDGDLVYADWTMGMGQAVVRETCLRGGSNYTLALNGYIFTQPSVLEIDSFVIQLVESDELLTLNNTLLREQYSYCVHLMQRLSTRNNSVLDQCEDVSFAVLTEAHNGALECNCSTLGTVEGTQCDTYGGQCVCKVGYIGRACDSCEAGRYSVVFGCPLCQCDTNGAIQSQFCNRVTGTCNCHPNVMGFRCDQCIVNYFNISSRMGCQDCGCHSNGSSILQCDEQSGVCPCNSGVEGSKCDHCGNEMYGFPNCSQCNCNEDGSLDNNCNSITGQCRCHSNTEGQSCDTCTDGTFHLHSTNPDGCQPCFCSGLTDQCSSASGYTYTSIDSHFTNTNSDNWNVDGNSILNNEGLLTYPNTSHLIAPMKYLGNKLSSYVQYIRVNLTINGHPASSNYDVLIMSNGATLYGIFKEELVTGTRTYSVQLHESSDWFTSDGIQPSSYLFQSVLIDLTGLYIRANLSSNESTIFHSISLDSTVYSGGINQTVGWVEECVCPSLAYTCLSCEECSDGYTRADNDSCIPCECNGLATLCDKDNGTCINCTGNTYGDMCQYCIQGHYDTRDGRGCSPCPCPLNYTEGQYSNTCTLMNDGRVVCTNCSEGHEGDNCERCGPGYYGDPTGAKTGNSTPCSDCMCNGNIDLTDPLACNMTTGLCKLCLFNTTGNMCQECLLGYYGDPIYAKNCTDCSCNSIGSVNSSCSNEGQCYCLPNVTGIQCSECVNSYYNYSSGEGCTYCNCNINGSIDSQCNINTGICTCKDTVMGDKCDTCITGYYGLDDNGCKDCSCSIGAVSVQCNDKGMCQCKPGVTGPKCDVCMIENTFQNMTTGLCDNCSSCYDDLKTDVDTLRSNYEITRVKVNAVAERNVPGTNFDDKQSYATQLVNDLYMKIVTLNETYTNYTRMISNVTLNPLYGDISEITRLLRLAEIRASPIINFAIVSENIMQQIQQELYESLSLLIYLNNTLVPRVENYLEIITNNTAEGMEQSNIAMDYISDFEIELNDLMDNASVSMIQANNSLQLAESIDELYQMLSSDLIELEDRVNELMINESLVESDLNHLDTMVSPGGNLTLRLNRINDSLNAFIIADIESLLSNVSALEQREEILRNETNDLYEQLQDLQADLSLHQQQYIDVEDRLNETLTDIETYSTLLNNAYRQAMLAYNTGNTCVINGERVLKALVSFNETIFGLRSDTDDILLMVITIEEETERIQDIVLNTTKSIDDIKTRLMTASSMISQLLNDTIDLKMTVNELHVNSTYLQTQSIAISNKTQTAIDNSSQLLLDTNTTLETIEQLRINVSLVSDTLNDPSLLSLPQDAAQLRSNASETFADLVQLFLTTPTPDETLIAEVESYINSVSAQINSTDILMLTQHLEDQLRGPLESDLVSLRSELQIMETEVDKLRNILDSLPTDCNN